ncbi:hypothetical protein [Geomicrobium sp. JCM 19055]|nr:hypothetical protein [Geomicrobium sp. JCM 19055]
MKNYQLVTLLFAKQAQTNVTVLQVLFLVAMEELHKLLSFLLLTRIKVLT